jgi:hypothetical protein
MNDEWGSSAAHEASHALCIHALGGKVNEIAVGPGAAEFADFELNGFVDHDRERLSSFDQLVVCVAGEIGASRHDRREVNWKSDRLRGDVPRATEIINAHFATYFADVTQTQYFRSACAAAESILNRNSLAITSLMFRLQRPPFRISGEDFLKIMERSYARQSN